MLSPKKSPRRNKWTHRFFWSLAHGDMWVASFQKDSSGRWFGLSEEQWRIGSLVISSSENETSARIHRVGSTPPTPKQPPCTGCPFSERGQLGQPRNGVVSRSRFLPLPQPWHGLVVWTWWFGWRKESPYVHQWSHVTPRRALGFFSNFRTYFRRCMKSCEAIQIRRDRPWHLGSLEPATKMSSSTSDLLTLEHSAQFLANTNRKGSVWWFLEWVIISTCFSSKPCRNHRNVKNVRKYTRNIIIYNYFKYPAWKDQTKEMDQHFRLISLQRYWYYRRRSVFLLCDLSTNNILVIWVPGPGMKGIGILRGVPNDRGPKAPIYHTPWKMMVGRRSFPIGNRTFQTLC